MREAGLGLTVSAVARRLGVAPATLRTWDRRYGIGPSAHEAGAHRRYSAHDLARLEHMRRLVISGVPPADAARAARSLEVDPTPPAREARGPRDMARPTLLPVPASPLDVPAEDAPTEDAPQEEARTEDAPRPGRAGGGQVIAIPGGAPGARGLARAAHALDIAACVDLVCETLDRRGVIWTWENLIVPVLVAVGEQWSTTGRGIEVEHALSESVEAAFTREASHLTSPVNERAVILASAPGEQHSLPLYAVSAALAERRVGCRVLGARLPTDSLQQAVARLGPAAVFLWAQIPGTADAHTATRLPVTRPGVTVILGGAGWSGEIPAGVIHVSTLGDATAHIARAVGE